MPTSVYKTPGVYVEELSAFPPSIRGVPTAIPIFIGYTEAALKDGKPIYIKPVKIKAMVDYEATFGKDFKTIYKIDDVTEGKPEADKYDFSVIDSSVTPAVTHYYTLKPTDATDARFNLYRSMQLFYANGGGDCYVVSVNPYLKNDGKPYKVEKKPLLDGLAAAGEQVGPTMTVIPDAINLTANLGEDPWKSTDFTDVVQAMLKQCHDLQDRVAILDVYGSQYVKTLDKSKQDENLTKVIEQFRLDVGEKHLSYGMSYFPFLHSTMVSESSIYYTNVDISDSSSDPTKFGKLQKVLALQNANLYGGTDRETAVTKYIEDIATVSATDEGEVKKLNQNLAASLPLLLDIERIVTHKDDMLPPSGAMAGVYTYADATVGVWNAPANISLTGVDKPEVLINADQQGDLNVPVDGKAVNALREFPGRGTVVWGARTLDGNSDDYRYIQVRRTLIYIEQSIKQALNQFVFAANDGNTWSTVTAMISSFLQGVWSQGGLMGATASEAFTVQCGLGSTMTSKDVLEGYMRVQVTLQMIRPAEFIVLTFKQKMEGAGS